MLEKEQLEALRLMAHNRGCSVGLLVREAIDNYLGEDTRALVEVAPPTPEQVKGFKEVLENYYRNHPYAKPESES